MNHLIRMTCVLGLWMMLAWVPVVSGQAATGAEGEGEQSIVVHLSHYSDDLHAVQMALGLATQLQKGGAQVTVFLDLEGVRLADSRGPSDLRWGRSNTVGEGFTAFTEAGGQVMLCAHCADMAGVTAAVLREGASIGNDAAVQQLFLGADKVIDF